MGFASSLVTSRKFEAVLTRPEGTGTWTYLVVPFDTGEEFGTKSQVRVKGTIDGQSFRSTLLPTGEGGHLLVVKSEIRRAIVKEAGETVSVTMERDLKPRSVKLPQELVVALDRNSKAHEVFAEMSYSHQKAYVEWIEQAKRSETRDDRAKRAIGMILRGIQAP